jgi:hypothetical protein
LWQPNFPLALFRAAPHICIMAENHLDPSEKVGWIFDVFIQKINASPGYVTQEWPYGVWISDEGAALNALKKKLETVDPATKIVPREPLTRSQAQFHGIAENEAKQLKS